MLDHIPDSSLSNANGKLTSSGADVAKDCISKILAASNLEKAGNLEGAIALYREVLELDRDGNYGAVAQKALETLEKQLETSKTYLATSTHSLESPEPEVVKVATFFSPRHWLQKFYDLPIRTKQLATLLTLELMSVIGIIGVGSYLIIHNGQAQLINQAKSELEVLEINYNRKIQQTSLVFAGLTKNPVFIKAAVSKRANSDLKTSLLHEMWKQKIEIATLVDINHRIVASVNLPRSGYSYNPNGLVKKALSSGEQVMSSEWISSADLASESPRFAELRAKELGVAPNTNPNFLIRYTVTPVREANSRIVGALISGDIVKAPIVADTVNAFNSGYSAVYLRSPDGKFTLATSQLKTNKNLVESNLAIPSDTLLKRAVVAGEASVTAKGMLGSQTHALAAKTLSDFNGEPVAILVRGTSQQALSSLISQSLTFQGLVLLLVFLVGIGLIRLLTQAIVKPLEQLQKVAQAFSSGERDIRAEAMSKDEIGQLTNTFNAMADNIIASEASLARQVAQQKAEAEKQRQARENLQQEVVKLLLEIEGAQKGDLTVKGKVTEGVVGSIADAFNTTISKLRDLVLQVKTVSGQVNKLSQSGEISVCQLSAAALIQSGEINQALKTVADINTSIQTVANSATEAAKIARQALVEAQEGDTTMDKTVDSIEKIRATVAGTSKKVKQLAESSQEISQIVGIISGISEKTNLLAFNASVEAIRAGEHGEGFRVVAEEVRRLADRVTESTKEIQHLVNTIQQETAIVLHSMEQSTTEVVSGTEFVLQTKQILRSLATTSQQIDVYLQEISSSTTTQTQASQQVNQKIAGVSAIAQETSTEAQDVVESLQTLVEQSQVLESSIAQFRLNQ